MNEKIKWDQSLIKKFSSSNHYKLLNQLRNEVKRYPLNNKKKLLTIQSKHTTIDNKNKSNALPVENSSVSHKTNDSSQFVSKQSSVSFNNSKNFSIYNQSSNVNVNKQNEISVAEQSLSKDPTSSSTFQDRLNQIDMK